MSTPNRPDMEWEVLLPLLSSFLDLTSEEQAQFLENLRAERPAIFEALTEILRKETNPPPPLLEALDQERFSALELRALAPGDQVGRYRLIRSLGRGGQGTVFEGVDDRLDRQVAVKVLHALSASVRPEVIISAPEIEAAARLNHTNICPILEGTTHDGIPMVVMPYLEGRTLRQVLSAWKDDPTSKSERIAMLRSVGRSVASALTEAHRVGVIHRDIKPSNLMISKDGKVTVLDFGISHMQVGPNDGNSYSRYGTPALKARIDSLSDTPTPARDRPFRSGAAAPLARRRHLDLVHAQSREHRCRGDHRACCQDRGSPGPRLLQGPDGTRDKRSV
ncbi:MAG TPA: serine/threonine-protein kinase [Planctomycetota bacterium]|nr:serine/threonine-protein kinase [Planctomycetota bacterium]